MPSTEKYLIISAAFLIFGVLIYLLFGRKHGSLKSKKLNEFPVDTGHSHAPSQGKSLPSAVFEAKSTESAKINEKSSAAEPSTAPITLSPWDAALKKSRDSFLVRLKDSLSELTGSQPWNDSHPLWESLEESLLAGDMGPRMTEQLLETLKKDFAEKPEPEILKKKLREKMLAVFQAVPKRSIIEAKPLVTILIGVNGAGKTTTAGKLASLAKAQNKDVVLGAGDTFRAAAVDQLKAWADRIGVECIVPAQGSSPSAVAFDTVTAGLARGADEIIIDTAGRLHTKDNLMDELKKIVRVIDKKIPGAPHRVLLVLDATLGQNAILQAKEFTAAVPATGVVLTKLDGSSKGGAAFSVSADLGIPVVYVGLGESATDLKPFSAEEFVENLLP